MSEAQAGGSPATTQALPSAARSRVTPRGMEAGSGRLKSSRGKSGDDGAKNESPKTAIERGSWQRAGPEAKFLGEGQISAICRAGSTLVSRGRRDVVKPPIPSTMDKLVVRGAAQHNLQN